MKPSDAVFATLTVVTLALFIFWLGYINGEMSIVTECESFGKFRTNADIYTCSKEQR